MIGNLLNNKQLTDLVERGVMKIDRFDPKKIHTYHYPLMPRDIFQVGNRRPNGQVDVKRVGPAVHDTRHFNFEQDQYLLVQIDEHIVIPDGIVAQFVSPYQLIEKGFQLNSGRMESPFGRENNRLVFGVKNLLSKANAFSLTEPVAYIYFFDLRGLDSAEYPLTPAEIKKFREFARRYRRFDDDGPDYEAEA